MPAQSNQTHNDPGKPVRNWKLVLSYHGAGFYGWQVQPGLRTVQGTLAQALREITGASLLPQGAGRTDAGVHALAQVASFELPVGIPPANLLRALNRTLPPDIRVLKAEIMPPAFHARHAARRKWYEYRIFERQPVKTSPERICSPFLAPFVWDCRWPLDLSALQQAAGLLPGTHDFSAMAASRQDVAQRDGSGVQAAPNPVKTIFSATWHRGDDQLIFTVCGSGFLHHMVRNLVGTLVDIGRGSLPPAALATILASRDRSQAGPTAPASGLFLRAVEYDALPAATAESTATLPLEMAGDRA